MVPFGHDPMMTVACSNKETGKVTRSMCKVDCIACGLCTKQTDMFAVQDNLARLDYTRYQSTSQSQTTMEKCPIKVIVYRGKSAPQPPQPTEKPAATVKV
jgi:ferredoxin